MHRWFYFCCLGLVTLASGCVQSVPANQAAAPNSTTSSSAVPPEAQAADAAPAAEAAASTQIALTPKNTRIEFVGNHTGEDPKPRHGSFQQVSGTAEVAGGLKSVKVDIQTESLTTEIEKLTNHLKSADFFDVKQFPKATFHSTAIKPTGEGTVEITGDLTLLGNTQSVTFPATVSTTPGLTLKATFTLDRTRWGMNYGLEGVEKEVPMTITIGG